MSTHTLQWIPTSIGTRQVGIKIVHHMVYVWYMVHMVYGTYCKWYIWYMVHMVYGTYGIWHIWYMEHMVYGTYGIYRSGFLPGLDDIS